MSEPIPLYTEREILDVRLDHGLGLYMDVSDEGPLCICSDIRDENTWVFFTVQHILDVMRSKRVVEEAMRGIRE